MSNFIKVDYDRAIGFFDRCLAIRKKLGNKADIAMTLLMLSNLNFSKGDLSKSSKYAKKSLTIKEIRKRDKCDAFDNLGTNLAVRGELDQALEYTEQLKKVSDEINHKSWRITAMWSAGFIFRLKGDLDQALEYFKNGLILTEESGLLVRKPVLFFNLIRIYIDKGLYKEAKRYLANFKQFVDQAKTRNAERLCQLSNGLVLKASSNIRDHFKTEIILKDFIDSKYPDKAFIDTAIIHLCDLLLIELRRTNDLNILDELKPLINQFINIAENQESFWRLADAKILQAKLALIQMNMGEARRFLTKAQIIADEHSLGLMAQKISSEHDTLLNQLSKWEKLKEEKADRFKEVIKMNFVDMQPIRRTGLPDDIAKAALWLASDDSTFVSGHPLVVDGGLIGGRMPAQNQDQWEEMGKILGIEDFEALRRRLNEDIAKMK